jgi:hypothetical protein
MPRKDGIRVAAEFRPDEWKPFEEVCRKLAEEGILPKNNYTFKYFFHTTYSYFPLISPL